MKAHTLLLSLILTFSFLWGQSQDLSFNSTNELSKSNIAPLTWKNQNVDLGNIEYNKPVTVAFEFTNNSDEAVVIKNVRTSCGCTVANYSNTVIKPGEGSTIEVTYNAKSKGFFNKSIDVTTSLKSESDRLTIKGNVN